LKYSPDTSLENVEMMNGLDIWCLRYECNISGIVENRNPPCASSRIVTSL